MVHISSATESTLCFTIPNVQRSRDIVYSRSGFEHLDSDVSMRSQVSQTVSACFGVLRQLRSIRRSLSHSVFQTLVAALVLTKLDLRNATLAGIPSFQLDRLQAVMNAAARLVYHSSRYRPYDNITLLLYRVHGKAAM